MKRSLVPIATAVIILGLYAACSDTTTVPKRTPGSSALHGLNTPPNETPDSLCMGPDTYAFGINYPSSSPYDALQGLAVGGTDLLCNSHDVSVAKAIIDSISFDAGVHWIVGPFDATNKVPCGAGDQMLASVSTDLTGGAKARYDIGVWIGDTQGQTGGAFTGSRCDHFNLITPANDLSPGKKFSTNVSDLDADQCGDISGGVNARAFLGVRTLTCTGTTDNPSNVTIPTCLAWQNSETGGGVRTCPVVDPYQQGPDVGSPISTPNGFRWGTAPQEKPKCNCDAIILPLDIKGKLELKKQLVPTTDGGLFNLFIKSGTTTVGSATDVGDGGTTGAILLSAGDYALSETAGTGTNLTNYISDDPVCVNRGDQSSVTVTSGSVHVSSTSDIVCTIKNTRKPRLTINKICDPTNDAGKFTLRNDGSAAPNGTDKSCGTGTGAFNTTIGGHTVSEIAGTGTSLTNYLTPVIGGDCATDGTITLAAGDNKTCSITNTRKARLTINKVCDPTNDPGKFTFKVDGSNATNGVDKSCGTGTGAFDIAAGSHTVSEVAGTGTDLTNYFSPEISGDCASDGTVSLAAGDSKTCTVTNKRKPRLTINKICDPTTDPGLFTLRDNGTAAPNGTDKSCGTGTGAFNTTTGLHTVSEIAGTGTDLTNYFSPVIGGDCAADGTITLANGDNKTCTITNKRKPRLTINKICDPTTDPGLFNLRDNGSTAPSGTDKACGTGTGAYNTTVGLHTVSELAGTGTDLTNYFAPVIGGDCAADGTITLANGDNKTCTITNKRKPRLTINKICNPTTDPGLFNLRDNGATAPSGTDKACGTGTGAYNTTVGLHTVSELAGTGTDLTNYFTPVIGGDCAADGTITLANGDNKTCTITNTRRARLTINKICDPTTDPGKFTLRDNGSAAPNGTDKTCGTGTGSFVVGSGLHTVSEVAGTGTDLTNYFAPVIGGDCAADGTITLANGDNKTCTITNSRKPRLTINKICDPTTDGGKFTLRNDGSAAPNGTDKSCGTGTGAFNTTVGPHTVSEIAGTGTDLTNYLAPVIGGDCAADGTITLANGDNKTCTITNTRKPRLTINKICVPTNDGGKFTLRNDGSAAPNGTDKSCGTGTGAFNTTAGLHTVSEVAGTGTDLTDYDTPIIGGDCAADGTITLANGDSKTCTITNKRLATLTLIKYVKGTSGETFAYTDLNLNPLSFSLVVPTAGCTAPSGSICAQRVFTKLLPGSFSFTEGDKPGWKLTDLNCSDQPDGSYDPLQTRTLNVSLAYGDNKTCHFTNEAETGLTTRTQGFWATHSSLTNTVWFGMSLADQTLCTGKVLDDLPKVLGGFWSNISQKSGKGGKRTSIDQARMQLLQQLLAAILNHAAFGASPSGSIGIADAKAAYCGNDETAIKNAQAAMAAFNTSGDNGLFTPGSSANGKVAKDLANIPYWDVLP